MWGVRFTKNAFSAFEDLDKPVRERVYKKLNWLSENFEDIPLQSLSGKLAGSYKLQAGDYRVIYELIRENQIIRVVDVGHRSEIYE